MSRSGFILPLRSDACFIGALLSLGAMFAAGCGGVTQPQVGVREAEMPQPMVRRGTVRIDRVENRTGRAECADLAHYVHLKAAQMLEARGWSVATDELLAAADFIDLGEATPASEAGGHVLRIELVRAEERAGATLSLGLMSSQGQSARVTVRTYWRDASEQTERMREASGVAAKGAWGVLAQVDRAALTRREGFWQFDRSLLGGAAADALGQAIHSFP